MNTYVAIHNHEYGASAYLFRASDIPDDVELAQTLNLDFEPERGESIDVCPVNLDDIATGPDARELLTTARTMVRELAMNAGSGTVRELPEHPQTFVDRITAFIGDAYDFETGEHSDGPDIEPDDCDRSGELANVRPLALEAFALDGDARPAHLDGGPAARSLVLMIRVNVPADCPLDDAGIVSAVNQCMEAGQADAIATIEHGEIDSPEADAVAGMTLGRINAILPDAGLIDTAARYRDAVRYSPAAGDVRDATELADAFLSLGIV